VKCSSLTTLCIIFFFALFSVISQKSNFHRSVEDICQRLFVSYLDILAPTNRNQNRKIQKFIIQCQVQCQIQKFVFRLLDEYYQLSWVYLIVPCCFISLNYIRRTAKIQIMKTSLSNREGCKIVACLLVRNWGRK
jgi:hypothetical protein